MAWDLNRFIWPLAAIAARPSIRVASTAGFSYKRPHEIITWGMSTVRVIVHPLRGCWRSYYRRPMSGVTDGLTEPLKCIMYCIRNKPSTCWFRRFRARVSRWIMQRSYVRPHPPLAREGLKILDTASYAPLAWLRFDTFDSMSYDSREHLSCLPRVSY